MLSVVLLLMDGVPPPLGSQARFVRRKVTPSDPFTHSLRLPPLHHFHGRGAKDVIPLWRDTEAELPNITEGILEVLQAAYGTVGIVSVRASDSRAEKF